MPVSKTGVACVLLLLSACDRSKGPSSTLLYPDLELSSTRLDFETTNFGDTKKRLVYVLNQGDMPMGVESVSLNDGEMEQSFSVSYSADDVVCPGSESTGARVATGAAAADDTGSTGDTGDTGASGSAAPADVIVLDAGCKLPVTVKMSPITVGQIESSLKVTTANGTDDSGERYYKDPDNEWRVVFLEGVGQKYSSNLITSPTNLSFGYVYVGNSATEYIRLRNVGNADVTLSAPALAEDCSSDFQIVSAPEEGRVLAGDSSALIEVSFTPSIEDAAECTLTFTSDDEDAPEVEISMQANEGDDPNNTNPTAEIRSPLPGYVLNGTAPLELEINVFDPDQSADSLTCKVKGVVLAGDTLATCTPTDESGHVFVSIPLTDLEEGVETILVSVKDSSGAYGYASTTVLYKDGYPSSDDDGDGFGDDADDEFYDCDDTDVYVYPEAAEIDDSKDNDCNGEVDEGTTGGDDDADGWSEDAGDCNDNDSSTYPDAEELGDRADNDCDGTVDEGSSLYDDDGDDFTEAEDDCNDHDSAINPAATEYCDGVDNDCNGLKDEQDGCVAFDSDPLIVGGIQMGVTALGVGESTTMTVYAYDAVGSSLTYSWEQDNDLTTMGHTAFDDTTAAVVTFTAPPSLPDGSSGQIFTVYAVVIDEDGNSDYALGEITVYPQPVDTEISTGTTLGGCGGSGGDSSSALLLLPALGGLLASRRRRG